MKKKPRKNKKALRKGGVKKPKRTVKKLATRKIKRHKPKRARKQKPKKIKRQKPKRIKRQKPRRKKLIKKAKKILSKKTKPRKKSAARRVVRKISQKIKSRKRPKPTKKRRKRTRKIKISKPRIYVGRGLLEQLFESQPKVKILKLFFRNYSESFTLKEIFKRLRMNMSLVRRELGKLEKFGLLKQKKAWLSFEKKRGGARKEQKLVYYINTGFDFFNELKNLILKSTIASREELITNVKKIGNIRVLALAGIFTGDETSKADILIVGDKINPRKLNTFIKDLEAEVGKELNCAAMSTREFNYRYDMYDRFVRDLIAGKSEILINRSNLW